MPQNNAAFLQAVADYHFMQSRFINHFQLQTDDSSIELGVIANELNIQIQNTDEKFNPDSEKLEYKILGHLLSITGSHELVSSSMRPIIAGKYEQKLTLHYMNSETLSTDVFKKLLSLSPIKSP